MSKQVALVTGATGLLGNNLVRLLLEKEFTVRALVRSKCKAAQQFKGLKIDVIEGDMADVAGFSNSLPGVDVVFHTAAHRRDSYKGGKHWDELHRVNVFGTAVLISRAYEAGVRRFVHTSSVAVLYGARGTQINETMLRDVKDADDYYRSKILAEREILKFLSIHPDMWAAMVLPGWMHGPGDIGPTSAGQITLDFVNRKLPGVIPGSFSVVDARDVAQALLLASEKGRRGHRYLAAGRHTTVAELFRRLEVVSGIKAPTRKIPMPLLRVLGFAGETTARLSKTPNLMSKATVRLIAREAGRSYYDPSKSARELNLQFRPIEDTLRDEIAWYRDNGWLDPVSVKERAASDIQIS